MKIKVLFAISLAACLLLTSPSFVQCSSIIHVITDGNDFNDGLSWATAKKTVQAGIDAASSGDEVWVAKGTYNENVIIKAHVSIYGGFVGTEETRDARDWRVNTTVLNAHGTGSNVVIVPAAVTTLTVIDGFTICNGGRYFTDCVMPLAVSNAAGAEYDPYSGGGIYCAGSATISNNTISNNVASTGAGIYCKPTSSPRIVNNTIKGNWGDIGGGIYCDGSATISNNNIFDNEVGYYGGGICCGSGSSPEISNNTITQNQVIYNNFFYDYGGGGICCEQHSFPNISGNMIIENYGEGIYCTSSSAIISNNTIAGNNSGISCYSCSPAISNNIVAFNPTGVYNSDGAPLLRNNDVYNPDGINYSGLTAGKGDISADPVFARLGTGNCHIQKDSPCKNMGWNDALGIGTADIDGQARVQDGTIDIGADESDGTIWTFTSVTVRVSTDGNDANDGSSWSLAKKTVQSAVNAAGPTGGEVWVKAGIYNECIHILPYVSIYGGFAGTEHAKSSRNWAANRTILDGRSRESVVSTSFPSYYRFSPSAIDGFTIRNGRGEYYGGGVCCLGPVAITNNLITGMKSDYGGGAIYCSGYATISNNTIYGNDASAGIYCDGHSQTLTNNTIVGNSGNGINCYNSSARVSNNIVAFNSSGISKSGNSSASFHNNDVYNPGGYNYSDNIAGNTDMSVNPHLCSLQDGILHIQPDSPCRDAGWNGASEIGTADADCQTRIQGERIDIGADESDGTLRAASLAIVHVSADGDDANDGSSWTLAKKTVQSAIGVARLSGGEVWVKKGVYKERILLGAPVSVYGGFAGTEDTKSARNWAMNETVLDGGMGGSVVTVKTSSCAIDGFTICNGNAEYGGGVYCEQRTSATISNNIITGNRANKDGGGIYSTFNASTMVSNNTISGNSAGFCGAGVFCSGPAAIIYNRISKNRHSGIYCEFSFPTISSNIITGNTGAGISCYGGSPTISNNTITENSASGINACYSAMISNNIIAFNAYGLYCDHDAPTLRNNCVYNPSGVNYLHVTAGPGDISADPQFVDVASGNLHIQPGSPCADAGWYYAPGTGTTDLDGQPRIQNHAIDIGAYESSGTLCSVEPVVVVRVDGANGSDSNDGSSWVSPMKTVQSAIERASALGGEVWVKEGIYNERIMLKTYVRVYGGFAGTEKALSERNWTMNETVLDGGQGGSVVTVPSPSNSLTGIDGFTIRNGKAIDGGGIYCPGCAVISNNMISANHASNRGGGVYCGELASLSNNVIVGNNAVSGGGVFCTGSTAVTNNTIIENSATSGGGMDCHSSWGEIVNNIIAFNSSGIYGSTSGTLRYNDVYNPAGDNYTGGTPAGIGDISADPLFVNRATGDYHLTSTSPCLNAGWNFVPYIFAIDMDGEIRPNGEVDLGADEYWPSATTISDVKLAEDGTSARIDGAIVSAAFVDFFYIESDNRACGVRVNSAGHSVSPGMRVHVIGVLSTNSDGERSIDASSVHRCDPPNNSGRLAPLAITNRLLGGGMCGKQSGVWGWILRTNNQGRIERVWGQMSGLNNIGLLIRTWGKFTKTSETTFTLDDGSGENVKCIAPSGVTLDSSWGYVVVTGISSCEKVGDELHKLVRIREQSDISVY